MKRSRFSEEQIIGILKEHQVGLGAKELCRKHGISDATFYKWCSRYGGMEVSDARRLKALEAENAGGADARCCDAEGDVGKKLLRMSHVAPLVRVTMANVQGGVPWTEP